MIVDTRTLTTKTNETQLYNSATFSTEEDTTNSFEEGSSVLVESSSVSHSTPEFSLPVSETPASYSAPRALEKKSMVYNHSTFKPTDIVSAAFEQAELDQFGPGGGNI